MKTCKKAVLWMVLLATVVMTCCSCEPVATGDADEGLAVVYNRYNIHHYLNKGKYYAGYANYVEPLQHGFLPANSAIVIGSYRRGFKVTDKESGMEIYFEFKSSNMGGMSKDEYLELITASAPMSYDHLSAVDKQGIQDGQVTQGMSKDGVMVAWGYPAKHRTPSLEDNTWTFWQDRFRTVQVNFGADGKVTNIVR